MLIDPYHERWLDRLNAAVDGATTYLLVDGAFIPGVYRLVNATLPSRPATSLLFETLPSCTDKTRNVSPFIVACHPSSTRLQTLLERCSGWPMISAIVTAESQVQITERLAAWCVVEAGDQRFNLRFPDTRRLPAIFDAFTATQRMEFSGPATRWSYVGRNGSWAELDVPRSPSAMAERPKLDDQQFARLVGESEVDEIISILAQRGNRMTRRHSEIYAGLATALRAANRLKLNTESKVEWCECCLRDGLPHEEFQAAERLATWMEITEYSASN